MTTLAPWTEQWQHVQTEIREPCWGDRTQHTRQSWQDCLGQLSVDARDRLGGREYERSPDRVDARNGVDERDFVTRLGTLRVRVARTRQRAFLRGLSSRAVGRIAALITEEPVSAQTVSRLTRDLDQAVAKFHQASLTDDWRCLFLDDVSLRVRRPSGRKRVQRFVAYGVRTAGRRGLEGRQLHLVVTDGCAGLAAALETVYPRVTHQRCGVHTLRNLLSAVRRRDHAAVKADAQAIYQAASRAEAEGHAQAFAQRWRDAYPRVVTRAALGSARVALVLPVSSSPLAEVADDQCD